MNVENLSKELILWTHEPTTSHSDALLNYDLIEHFEVADHVLEITLVPSPAVPSGQRPQRVPRKRLVVLPAAASPEIKKKTPNLQLSLLTHLSNVFKLAPRSAATVIAVPKSQHLADYMVLYFRDQYISRSDMWRAACGLEGQCIYVGKRITSIAGIRAEVREIWRNGRKKSSAYVSASTKPVFRSESARYLIFIQMSKEMWEFEEDGELFYNKAIDGFLPELFKRWKTMNAHHLVSIVLFTRVTYRGTVGPFCLAEPRSGDTNPPRLEDDYAFHNDFYKIVVDNVSSHNWESTLTALKRELHSFQRDVMLQKMRDKPETSEQIISGYLSTAMEGNILEAINLAAHQFNRDYIDRDLLRTGTSMIFITAGSGLFEVNENLLKLTGENLLGNGIGIDIVCLSKRPLHVTPLFKYLRDDKRGDSSKKADAHHTSAYDYVLPYICEISYYGDHHTLDLASTDKKFQARLKMHELQMMGLMENEMSSISIDYLSHHGLFRDKHGSKHSMTIEQGMDVYDEVCFLPPARSNYLLKSFMTTENSFDASEGQLLDGSQLFGTRVPSSRYEADFRGLYEKSKSLAIKNSSSGSHFGHDSNVSTDSSMRGSAQWSFDSKNGCLDAEHFEQAQKVIESKPASPKKSIMKRPQISRVFSNPAASIMALKSQPSLSGISGAVTISSALEQSHRPVVTKGFMLPEKGENGAAAIPIKLKDAQKTVSISPNLPRKHLTPLDIVENHVRSVSQSLRNTPNERRYSNVQSKASLAKLKAELQIAEPLPNPWHVLENPSYPSKNASTWNVKSWRWAHVSNRARKTGGMNWESMCAPAALPLTSYAVIDLDELKTTRFSENSYSIYINPEVQTLSQKDLLREMISQRLGQGYQIAIAKTLNGSNRNSRRGSIRDTLAHGPLGEMGETVYLTHAEMEIHCITCDATGYMIEVVRYVRNRDAPRPIGYNSLIWQLARDDGYEDNVVLFKPISSTHNWNYVDQVMSGTEKRLTESIRFWRARFLFLPTDTSRDKRPSNPGEQFTEEEIRVAGVHKICELIQKAAYLTPSEVRAQRNKVQDPVAVAPMNVAFTTLYPTAYIKHEIQHFPNNQGDHDLLRRNVHEGTTKTFMAKDFSLYDLSNEMQSDKGVSIKDRLWHWRWYESSFVGSDLVTWLVERTDIQNREEAVKYGEGLMERGLFEHVQKIHGFLDGFYLYRLKSEYSSKTAKTWFGTRKVTPNITAQSARNRAQSNVSVSPLNSPVLRPQKSKSKYRYELTRWLRIDVDPHKKSYRPEFVIIHLDTLEWIAVTARLVEEAIQQWARIAEKYGLKLVEAPVDEACAVTVSNPFRAPLAIKLVVDPPAAPTADLPASSSVSQSSASSIKRQPSDGREASAEDTEANENTEIWMSRILKYWNFILDQEAAHKFPNNAEVVYSWGKPGYKYTQYIHRSGMSICQITPKGFLWLTNRLCVSRSISSSTNTINANLNREASKDQMNREASTQSSALPYTGKRQVHPSSIGPSLDPDELRNNFRDWCSSIESLTAFYLDASMTETPQQTPSLPPQQHGSSILRESTATDRGEANPLNVLFGPSSTLETDDRPNSQDNLSLHG